MNYRKLLMHVVGITLVTVFLVRCSAPTTTPLAPPSTSISPTTAQEVVATLPPTPTSIPPTTMQEVASTSAPTVTPEAGPADLWEDATQATIGTTREWTNKVELADINGDSLVDILFANGGDYETPGQPAFSRVFLNQGPARCSRR